MSFSLWLAFAATIAIASLSPGPNVLITMSHSLKYGWRAARFTILGNLLCLFLISIIAAVGVGAVINSTPLAYSIMKIGGGLYLIYLGISMIRSTLKNLNQIVIDEVDDGKMPKPHMLIAESFMVTASNPKAIVFLSAVFPQFLDSTAPILQQFGVMFLTIIAIVVLIHSAYALLVSRFRKQMLRSRVRKIISRITGVTFIGLGIGVAFSR